MSNRPRAIKISANAYTNPVFIRNRQSPSDRASECIKKNDRDDHSFTTAENGNNTALFACHIYNLSNFIAGVFNAGTYML